MGWASPVLLLLAVSESGAANDVDIAASHFADAAADCLHATDKDGVSAERLAASGWKSAGEFEIDHLPQNAFVRADRKFVIKSSTFDLLKSPHCSANIEVGDLKQYEAFKSAMISKLGRRADSIYNRPINDGQPETTQELTWNYPDVTLELSVWPVMKFGPERPSVSFSVIPKEESGK